MKSSDLYDRLYTFATKPSLLLLLSFVLLCLFSLTYDPMYYDEGMWNYIGQGWALHGSPPYTGAVENKTPGIFLVFALSNLLFGVNVFFPRLLGVLSLVAASYALYRFTKTIYGHLAGVFSLLLFSWTMCWYSMDGMYTSTTESFMVLFEILSFLLLLMTRFEKASGQLGKIFLSGACMGLAMAFKQIAVMNAMALFLFALQGLWKRDRFFPNLVLYALFLAAGIITASLLSYLPLLFSGLGLMDYIQGGWLILLQEGLSPDPGERTWKLFQAWSQNKVLLFYPFLFLFLINKSNLQRSGVPFWGLLTWMFFSFLAVNASGRYYGHQFKQLIPSLSVTSGIALAFLLQEANLGKIASFLGFRTTDPVRLRKKTVCITAGVLFFLWILVDPQIHVFLAGRIKHKEDKGRTLASRIEQITDENNTVYLWRVPMNAVAYAYSGRRAPTRFFTQHFNQISGAQQEIERDVRARPPKIFVMEPNERDIPAWLRAFLAERYDREHRYPEYDIFVIRGEGPSPDNSRPLPESSP